MTNTAARGVVSFTGVVHQNLFLPVGGSEVHAVLTLDATCDDPGPRHAVPAAAEVLILDGSGSMDRDQKRERAIEAGAAAIEQIRDGVAFAVITGTHEAAMLWPAAPELRMADAQTRAEATQALQALPTAGGTAMGRWLRLARELLHGHPSALRHVTLVSDGRNEHETSQQLDDAVRSCVGELRCDSRGVGVDFDPAELYNVAEKLNGTVRAIANPAELADDFASITTAAMEKVVEVQLELSTPANAKVRFVKQTQPMIAELDPQRPNTTSGTERYLLGAWGTKGRSDSHTYHICIDIEPPPIDDETPRKTLPTGQLVPAEKLLGRISLAVRDPQPDDPELVQSFQQFEPDSSSFTKNRGQIRAFWTDDPAAPLIPNDQVAIVTDSVGLAEDLRAGVVAWRGGHLDAANNLLRDVRSRAKQLGNLALKQRLDEVYDERSDSFRLDARDQVELFEESTVTTRLDS